jgi:hypothetical protein
MQHDCAIVNISLRPLSYSTTYWPCVNCEKLQALRSIVISRRLPTHSILGFLVVSPQNKPSHKVCAVLTP